MPEARRTGKPRRDKDVRGGTKREGAVKEDADLAEKPRDASADDAERALGRMFKWGIRIVGVLGAISVGLTGGLGPALLVLAGTTLLGTIAFFWASLRTLSGDAPLPEGVEGHAFWTRAPAPERKREALRALKDLELEHAIGKIDDADFAELSGRYRSAAKAVMREMDAGLAPRRDKAEALVRAYLAKQKDVALPDKDEGDASAPNLALTAPLPVESEPAITDKSPELTRSKRVTCDKCSVSNEPDASFCKKCGNPLSSSSPDEPSRSDVSA